MCKPESRADLRKELKLSSTDSFFSSLMTGSGETLLPAFALALGMNGATAGLYASLPYLVGSSFQLFSRRLALRFGSYKRLCVLGSLLQAISLLPLAYVGLLSDGKKTGLEDFSLTLVFLLTTLYWGFGGTMTPAWTTWMGAIVPGSMRARYFAFRNRVGQLGLLVGVIGGGLLLQAFKTAGHELLAFSLLFTFAGVARIFSLLCLKAQSETTQVRSLVKSETRVSSRALVRNARYGQDGKLFAYLLGFQVALNFSAPFFTPLLLTKHKLSYAAYIALVAVAFTVKVFVLPTVGAWCRTHGPVRSMKIGTLLYALCPVLYVTAPNFTVLILAQVVSGIGGAFFDLGSTVSTYNLIDGSRRTSFISKLNFANAVALFIGSSVGAQILALGQETYSAYLVLFVFASCARLASVLLLNRIEQTKKAEPVVQPSLMESGLDLTASAPVAAQVSAELERAAS